MLILLKVCSEIRRISEKDVFSFMENPFELNLYDRYMEVTRQTLNIKTEEDVLESQTVTEPSGNKGR